MEFKRSSYEFLIHIYKISEKIHARLRSHVLKKAFLDQVFESELKLMMQSAMNKIKTRRFKVLAIALTTITQKKKVAILDEYFKICKYTYMIRAIFAYNWKVQSDKPGVMVEMQDPDSTIFKLSKIVQNSLANVFEDTKPD